MLSPFEKDTEIYSVVVLDGGTTLDLAVAGCNADLDIDVSESTETVKITLTHKDGGCFANGYDDRADKVLVELEEPLGTRTIVGSDGEAVPVVTAHGYA